MPQERVIVVGSSNTDLVVHCATLPAAGQTVLGGDLLTFAGGKGANQAVAAARAGAKVRFIGAFGDDAFGKARRADLEREGIDCSGCVTKKGVPSGVALIAIGAAGAGRKRAKAENLIVVAPGANARLTPADVARGMSKDLGAGDVVLASLEIPVPALERAFALAARNGAFTVLNPAPAAPRASLAKLLARSMALTPNETEFTALFGRIPITPAGARKLARNFHPHAALRSLIVTRGARGWRASTRTLRAGLACSPRLPPREARGHRRRGRLLQRLPRRVSGRPR
ncbi:MAG: PfkB family carbohydrate kinase [Planctomycetota bacterium]|nr:PfkB family carbohydrate kinase [Planctomycetota bacterium]